MRWLALLSLLAFDVAAADVSLNGHDLKKQVDCHKDPVVNLLGNHNTYRVVGPCRQVSLGGDDNALTADIVSMIAVSGNHNTITANATDQVGVSGNANTINWKRTILARKKPAVLDRGEKNKITQTK